MKNCRNYMLMILFVSLMSIPLSVTSSWENWKTKSCVSNNMTGCNVLSDNFKDPYCINSSVDNALDCVWPSVVNELSSIKSSTQDSVRSLGDARLRDVVEKYCETLLGEENYGRIYFARPSDVHEGWDRAQTFDSRQSIFVYALCSSFKDEEGMSFVDESPYSKDFLENVFKTEDLVGTLKLKQKSGGKDLCNLADESDINDCDMSIYASEIYSAIMSDLFKIEYAQVLHVNKMEDFKSEDKALEFMSGYFNYFKKSWKELNTEYPYAQTLRVLQSNQQYYKRVLGTVKIINNSELADIASNKKKCQKTDNMVGYNFVACALHSSQAEGAAITPAFVTLIYNEMMNYRIFQQYVNRWISEKTIVMREEKRNEKDVKKFEDKALDFQGYAGLQTEATKYALRGLVDFNMTYPFHIGLLLYQESIKDFRDKHLSPIVTLFYSLSEKLQNVQLTN